MAIADEGERATAMVPNIVETASRKAGGKLAIKGMKADRVKIASVVPINTTIVTPEI